MKAMTPESNNIPFSDNAPVTVMVTRHVKPGCEKKFEALVSDLDKKARTFPGHLGTNVFRPTPKGQQYHLIYKFDSLKHFQDWKSSEIRTNAYIDIQELLLEEPKLEVLSGLETWFTLPNQPAIIPPPRYKMAIVSWLAIYPLVVLILSLLNPILVTLPIVARAALITLIAIPTMTYVLMPNMAKLFARWLYPPVPGQVELE
jgi:antibiotic biosynthesis monooxygenase (ABM) superfamily enzyme